MIMNDIEIAAKLCNCAKSDILKVRRDAAGVLIVIMVWGAKHMFQPQQVAAVKDDVGVNPRVDPPVVIVRDTAAATHSRKKPRIESEE